MQEPLGYPYRLCVEIAIVLVAHWVNALLPKLLPAMLKFSEPLLKALRELFL